MVKRVQKERLEEEDQRVVIRVQEDPKWSWRTPYTQTQVQGVQGFAQNNIKRTCTCSCSSAENFRHGRGVG